MALQNIGASNQDDAFYRYKMPKMVTKIEGRGNGIKTNIVNMVDVAKALGRPPSYTTKYFGCELGAQSKFDEKTGTSLVNGAHDTAKLAALLENFIKKYVQCYGCGNPETEINISKIQKITLKCAACGHVSDVDMLDKLTTFILKNPPVKKAGKDKKALRRAEKERLKAGEAVDEDTKKVKKESKKKGHEGVSKVTKKKGSSDEDRSPQSQEEEDNGYEVQWYTDTSMEAAQQRIKEQLNSVTSEMVMLETHEDHEKAKATKKSSGKNGEVEVDNKCNGESDKVSQNQHEPDVDEIEANVDELKLSSIHDDLVLAFKDRIKNTNTPSQLASFLQSSNGTPQEIMNAYFEALFDGVGKGFSKELIKKKKYLSEVVKDENSQLILLGAVEAFCQHASPEAVKEVALVIKVMYDQDIVDEENIFQWYEKSSAEVGNQAVWKKVKPFIEWLKNAEAES
uniref:TSA: Wollemia nobilis Ref_Wollemi_Transcript_12334_2226 transcribed RNA sequence n=1 Tax=Wollemia nobilis TaxID=56998 RepID=A0A0C9QS36_9CONI